MSSLRQPQGRTALVRLLRHHIEEGRVKVPSEGGAYVSDNFSFGSLHIDGNTYENDVVMFSSTDSGVCPKSLRNFLDGFFLRLRISPRSMSLDRLFFRTF